MTLFVREGKAEGDTGEKGARIILPRRLSFVGNPQQYLSVIRPPSEEATASTAWG